MRLLGEWARRVRFLFHRRALEEELRQEMEAHREMLGTPARFGNTLRLREEAGDVWGWRWLDQLVQDVRYAARTLARAPGFTLTSVIILGLGIGLNLALVQLAGALFIRPLPVRDPATLVRFYERSVASDGALNTSSLSYEAGKFVRDNGSILSAILADSPVEAVWGDDGADNVRAHLVTANWFDELGAAPARGRLFHAGVDDAPGAAPAVVLSDAFWRAALGADSTVVGRAIRINNSPATIIGVASPRAPALDIRDPQLWLVIEQADYFRAPIGGVEIYGRLRPGLSPDAVREGSRAPLREAARQGLIQDKDPWLEPYYAADRFQPPQDVHVRWLATALMGSLTLLVLLVACANLGNVHLSRAIGRLRELSIRTALGATRGRVIRMLLTESALIACLGTILGLALGGIAAWGIGGMTDLPSYIEYTPDWRATVVGVVLAMLTVIAIGLVPVLRLSRTDLAASIKDGTQHSSSGLQRTRFRQTLVAIQIGGSCLLVIVAALLLRSFVEVVTRSPGFDYENVAVLDPALALERYKLDAPAAQAFWETVERRLSLVGETQAMALVSSAPLGRTSMTSTFRSAPGVQVSNVSVEPSFFSLMHVPIISGRTFLAQDDPAHTAIVSRALALAAFGGLDVLGKEFPPGVTIVGVSGDARVKQIQATNFVELYRPMAPGALATATLLVRARSNAARMLNPMRDAARFADSRVEAQARLMSDDYDAQLRGPRVALVVAGTLAGLALVIACLGIFGVVSFGAAARSKEIGIRLALGAPRGAVLGTLLRQILWPSAIGVTAGIAGSAAIVGVMRGDPLYLPSFSPVVAIAAVGLLAATALGAALIPALRALRNDPLQSLRSD